MKFYYQAIAFSFAITFCHAQDIVQQLLDQLKDTSPRPQLNNGTLSVSPTLNSIVTNIISRGMIQLALDLNHAILANTSHHENVLLSPSCLQTTLATVLLGSRGKTFLEISKALGFDDPNLTGHTEILHRVLSATQKNYKTKQSLVDFHPLAQCSPGFFLQRSFPLTETFQEASKELYGAEIISVDFTLDQKVAKNAINAWVQKKSKDRIQNVLYALPDPSDKLTVTSAWSFKGEWFEKFQKYPTRMPFKTESDGPLYVDMVYQESNFPFYDDDELGVRIVGIPYRGFEVTTYLILPKSENVTELLEVKQNLTTEKIDELISKMDQRKVLLCFPRLKLSSSMNLRKALKDLGILALFDPETADLGLLSPGNAKASPQNPGQTSGSSAIDSNPLLAQLGGMDMESLDRIMGNKPPKSANSPPSSTTQESTYTDSMLQNGIQRTKSDPINFETSSSQPSVPSTKSPPYQSTEVYSSSSKESSSLPSDNNPFPLVSPSYTHTRLYTPAPKTSTIPPPKFRNVPTVPPSYSSTREYFHVPETSTPSSSVDPTTLPTSTSQATTKKYSPSHRVKTTTTEATMETTEIKRRTQTVHTTTPKPYTKHDMNIPRVKIPTSTRRPVRIGTTKTPEISSTKANEPTHTQPINLIYEYPGGNRPNFTWRIPPRITSNSSSGIGTSGALDDSFRTYDPSLNVPPIVEADPNTDEKIPDGAYTFQDQCNYYIYEQLPFAIKWQQIARCKRNLGNYPTLSGIDKMRDKTRISNPGLNVKDFVHAVDMHMDHDGSDINSAVDLNVKPIYASSDAEYFVVNKPFVMMVAHNPSKTILFWGNINQPSPIYRQP